MSVDPADDADLWLWAEDPDGSVVGAAAMHAAVPAAAVAGRVPGRGGRRLAGRRWRVRPHLPGVAGMLP